MSARVFRRDGLTVGRSDGPTVQPPNRSTIPWFHCALVSLVFLLAPAPLHAVQRFPQPQFDTGHVVPVATHQAVFQVLPPWADALVIMAMLLLTAWAVLRRRSGRMIMALALPIVMILLFGYALTLDVDRIPSIEAGVLAISAVIVLMAAAAASFVVNRHVARGFWIQSGAMVLVSALVMMLLAPSVAPYYSSMNIAAAFSVRYDGSSPVYVHQELRPGFTFYSGVRSAEFKKGTDLSSLLKNGAKGYFIARSQDWQALSEPEKQMLIELSADSDRLLLKTK